MVVTLSQMVWTFPGGRLVQSVTSITLVNNTTKTQDTTIPAGKRWLLLNVKAVNCDDVNRFIGINLYKEAAKTNLIKVLTDGTITTLERINWPNTTANINSGVTHFALVLMEEGNTLSVIFQTGGASTGATDVDGLVVEYLEIDA